MARLVIAAALICLSHWASATYSSGGGYGGGGYGGDYGYSGSGGYGGGAYHGPLAQPVVLANGFLADTKEVAAAKGAHYLALLSAKSSSGYGGGYGGGFGGGYGGGYGGGAGYNGGGAGYSGGGAGYSGGGAGYSGGGGYGGGAYHGPLAQPVVLSSGYLADTKEVAAAKGAHYVALSEASARSGYGGGDGGYYGKQY